jgi:hypothetical protein
MKTVVRAILLCCAVLVLGCKAPPPKAAGALSDEKLALQAGASFLACYERDGAECRATDVPFTAWAALEAVALLRDGIPTDILDRLPPMISAARDPDRLRRAVIANLGRQHEWVRNAGCTVRTAHSLASEIKALASAAQDRVGSLGIANLQIGQRADELAASLDALARAHMVTATCSGDRQLLLLIAPASHEATGPLDESAGATLRCLTVYAAEPLWLRPKPSAAPTRARAPALEDKNQLSTWLPIYEEQL